MKNVETKSNAQLKYYQFILVDGTIVTVAAADYVSAAKIARTMY